MLDRCVGRCIRLFEGRVVIVHFFSPKLDPARLITSRRQPSSVGSPLRPVRQSLR
jgi:hypothetical protein